MPGRNSSGATGCMARMGRHSRGTRPRKAVVRMETDEGLRGAWRSSAAMSSSTCPAPVPSLHRRRPAADRTALDADVGGRPGRGNSHLGTGPPRRALLGREVQGANLPVYQMLGGNERSVPAYASTVTWPTLDEYERHIKLCRDLGFTAFKLHAWGDVKRDIELSRALRKMGRSRCRPDVRRLGRLGLRRRAEGRPGAAGRRLPLVRGADARVPPRRLRQALPRSSTSRSSPPRPPTAFTGTWRVGSRRGRST